MKLSAFGEKFTSRSGINLLMDDLGHALAPESEMIMMGGGNPAHIPEVQERLRKRMEEILSSEKSFQRLIGIYDPPQGATDFILALCNMLNEHYGWNLTVENIGLTNGSQAAFFMLFNLFAGEFSDGTSKQIHLPLTPEYIGYADSGLNHHFFKASRPKIEHLDNHTFKYHIDFENFKITQSTGAICVSRPTNPTGNVLTDNEILRLDALAKSHNVPLIIDSAYGTPFPQLIFTPAKAIWNENIILCLSLSKFGLPAARTGIVVAEKSVIKALSGVNAIMNLATGSFGSMLVHDLVQSGEIIRMSKELIRPYYLGKAERAQTLLRACLKGLPYSLHKVEGAMFLWLWLKDCPVSSEQLYERLKHRGVLVVSGHHFFPGLDDENDQAWSHRHECLRITYSQDDELVDRGLKIIADEIHRAYL